MHFIKTYDFNVEYFLDTFFKYNPMDHPLQPTVKYIIRKNSEEYLKLKAIKEFPIIRIDDIIQKYYLLFVGDIVRTTDQINDTLTEQYFRVEPALKFITKQK